MNDDQLRAFVDAMPPEDRRLCSHMAVWAADQDPDNVDPRTAELWRIHGLIVDADVADRAVAREVDIAMTLGAWSGE